jgi:hypothetical protein
MGRRDLMLPTRADVCSDAVAEHGGKRLAVWLDEIRAGYHEAIEQLLALVAGGANIQTYAVLEAAMLDQCETEALDEILIDMEWALDSYVDDLVADRNRCWP